MLTLAILAAVTLCDFETPAERAAVAKSWRPDAFTWTVERKFALSGEHALHFWAKPWMNGLPEWPSTTITIPATDMTPYDRLVVDVVSQSGVDGAFSVFLANAEGRIQNGLHVRTVLPACGYRQWIIPLKDWPITTDPKAITRVHFFVDHPKGFDIYLDHLVLLKPGESVPVASPFARDAVPLYEQMMSRLRLEKAEAVERAEHADAYWRFRADCAAAGQNVAEMLVGEAPAERKIRPRAAFFASPAKTVRMSMARHEKESVQILVAPGDADLKNVRIVASDLVGPKGTRLAARQIACPPLGYVNCTNDVPYKVSRTEADGSRSFAIPGWGWWPDPIMDNLTACDVKGRDVQSFWVRVTCPDDQPAGVYTGTLTVKAEGCTDRTLPLTVRVYDFSVPVLSPLPLAVTFCPSLKDWKRQADRWVDLLANYYFMPDNLYTRGEVHWEHLVRLNREGRLGRFNLGYFDYPKQDDPDASRWASETLAYLRRNYAKAKELGLLGKAYIYGVDEVKPEYFDAIKKAVAILKREFPDVMIMTTAYDEAYGVGSPLAEMTAFCPLTPKYDSEKAKVARAAGHEVWWYICCSPHAPAANMFVESEGVEARSLMGAQTVKFRPDGFLYYQTGIWRMSRPLSTGPFTDWNPVSWNVYHGDGSWFCCGPDGIPLATQRVENFRDGLEDYAYAMELERRLAKCADRQSPDAQTAAKLLAVPEKLVKDVKTFSGDPRLLHKWRDAMAELIEKL